MIKELEEAYKIYEQKTALPRENSLGDMFSRWLTGKEKEPAECDVEFSHAVIACVDGIVEQKEPGKAYEAAEIMLSHPTDRKINETSMVLVSVHTLISRLIPEMSMEEAEKTLLLLDNIPRCYRFPVHDKLRRELKEKLQKK